MKTKMAVSALVLAVAATGAVAEPDAGERYAGGLVNFLVAPDSARELDGIGVHGLYGARLLGWPVEYRAFYDMLETQNGPDEEFYRVGGGVDALLGLKRLGVPELPGITPFLLGGGGVVYGDAVPDRDAELGAFINAGLGVMSKALTGNGLRVRGDLKYVYETLGDGYTDLHFALGLQLPLGAAAAGGAGEKVGVVPAEDDSDGDGVGDSRDQCPGTAPGIRVLKNGCEPKAVVALEGVTFDVDSEQLSDGSLTILDEAVVTLTTRYPDAHVEVAGHADDSGSLGYNLRLSERRAAAVRQYLVTRGLDESRLTAEGYGESQPVGDNGTEEGRAQNRRVELRIKP